LLPKPYAVDPEHPETCPTATGLCPESSSNFHSQCEGSGEENNKIRKNQKNCGNKTM